MEGPVWLAATPPPGPGARGQRNLQRQINEGQFTPSGSLPGCLGLSHSPGVQRAALESYLPAPPPNRATPLSLLGSGGPRAVNRGSTSDDPLPESLMLSACSWSHGPPVYSSLPASSCHLLQSLTTRRGRVLPFPSTISQPPVLKSMGRKGVFPIQ